MRQWSDLVSGLTSFNTELWKSFRHFLTANRKKTFRRISSYNFGYKKKALKDFLASSSSWKIANIGEPAYNINLQGCLYAETYMTQDFQRHFNLNTCLCEWKLLSLQLFYGISFLLLIVSSVFCNFLKSLCRLFSVEHEHRLQEHSQCRAYQTLLKITHNKTIK